MLSCLSNHDVEEWIKSGNSIFKLEMFLMWRFELDSGPAETFYLEEIRANFSQ